MLPYTLYSPFFPPLAPLSSLTLCTRTACITWAEKNTHKTAFIYIILFIYRFTPLRGPPLPSQTPPEGPAPQRPVPTMPGATTRPHVTGAPKMAAPSGCRPQPGGQGGTGAGPAPGPGPGAGPAALRGPEEDAEGLYVAVERCPLCNTTRRRLTCAKCVRGGDFVFFDGRDSERYRGGGRGGVLGPAPPLSPAGEAVGMLLTRPHGVGEAPWVRWGVPGVAPPPVMGSWGAAGVCLGGSSAP